MNRKNETNKLIKSLLAFIKAKKLTEEIIPFLDGNYYKIPGRASYLAVNGQEVHDIPSTLEYIGSILKKPSNKLQDMVDRWAIISMYKPPVNAIEQYAIDQFCSDYEHRCFNNPQQPYGYISKSAIKRNKIRDLYKALSIEIFNAVTDDETKLGIIHSTAMLRRQTLEAVKG